jgi:serine/threonine-protein kinase
MTFSADNDPRIGVELNGRYRITERLGEGGMGVVYRGERMQLDRPVAVKFLHSPYASSPKFVKRFQREARAMSRLSHPCCVSVIDFGVHESPYIVMDFVTGKTLRTAMDEGRLTAPRAVSIVRQVLSGLSHAHEQGVVHRDIKPANIMLGEAAGMGDHVRIFDFGLAKLYDPSLGGDPSMTGVVGTPAYMAPEQTRGDRVDVRVDLYATGVVLFELLVGHKPFDGPDAYATLRMQRDVLPRRVRDLEPEVSPELDAVVQRALEKDPEKRFQTASEFLAALDQVPEATGRAATDKSHEEVAFAHTQRVRTPYGTPSEGTPQSPPQSPPTQDAATELSLPPPRSPARRRTPVLLGLSFLILAGLTAVGLSLHSGDDAAAARAAGVSDAPYARVNRGDSVDPTFAAPSEANAPDAARKLDAAVEPDAAKADALDAPDAEVDDLSDVDMAIADEELNATTELEASAVPDEDIAVRSLSDVRALVRTGDLDAAIKGLRTLRRKSQRDANLPYMLGDLYFQRGWWTDGLVKYREAIRMQKSLRERPSVQKNAIQALGQAKTYSRARTLLVKDIGRAAIPRLKRAAKSDRSKDVRRRAAQILRRL